MSAKITNDFRAAIVTRYAGPTNYRGSRIIAHVVGVPGVLTRPYDPMLSESVNHMSAALALANKRGWHVTMAQGRITDTRYAFVCYEAQAAVDDERRQRRLLEARARVHAALGELYPHLVSTSGFDGVEERIHQIIGEVVNG